MTYNASQNNHLCKSCNGQTKWMYFLIEDKDSLENIIIFGIKSALISERNLTACSSIANREFHFLKLKNFFFGLNFFFELGIKSGTSSWICYYCSKYRVQLEEDICCIISHKLFEHSFWECR